MTLFGLFTCIMGYKQQPLSLRIREVVEIQACIKESDI